MPAQLINNCIKAVGKIVCRDFGQSGSGFFIDDEGHFLTNNHVVTKMGIDRLGAIRLDYSRDIYVKFGNNAYNASILIDENSDRPFVFDYCILKLNDSPSDHICVADLSQINQGERVFAIGYPSGFEMPIVTSGIISAMLRMPSHRNSLHTMKTFLTDAVATYGNSGGPLIRSTDGKVIGIVTMPHEIRNRIKDRLQRHLAKVTPPINDIIKFIMRYLHEGFVYAISLEHVLNDPAFPQGGDN